MKRLLALLAVFALTACSSPSNEVDATTLTVTGGDISETYVRTDLEALGATESEFQGVVYTGVAVDTLLADAGFDTAAVTAVKAVASDGFTVNYDPAQVFSDGVIVAYALPDGDMSTEDGVFRMVLPDAEGKLNVRMLVELQVTQ